MSAVGDLTAQEPARSLPSPLSALFTTSGSDIQKDFTSPVSPVQAVGDRNEEQDTISKQFGPVALINPEVTSREERAVDGCLIPRSDSPGLGEKDGKSITLTKCVRFVKDDVGGHQTHQSQDELTRLDNWAQEQIKNEHEGAGALRQGICNKAADILWLAQDREAASEPDGDGERQAGLQPLIENEGKQTLPSIGLFTTPKMLLGTHGPSQERSILQAADPLPPPTK